MESLIHLFNTAIARLGGEQLPLNRSPQENDATGTLCANLFPHVLDLALSAYEWGFAKKRVVLALLPEPQPHSHAYAFKYAMPTDCVKPVRIVVPARGLSEWGAGLQRLNKPPAYIIEGDALLTNVGGAEFLYVARIREPKLWPPAFADVLAWGLAGELASARINDTNKQQWCYQNYEVALAKACAQDRAFNNPHEPVSPWQAARGNVGMHSTRGGVW